MLDPRRLIVFREVAKRRSFSHAAAALSLTQPAVSQQIRALETQLGERLIVRGRTSFALTPIGELLFAHAEALGERLQLAETQVDEALAEERQRLRIGAFPSILGVLVPTAIAQLSRALGPLEVTAVQGSTDELVTGVRDGSLHVALCFQDAVAASPRARGDAACRPPRGADGRRARSTTPSDGPTVDPPRGSRARSVADRGARRADRARLPRRRIRAARSRTSPMIRLAINGLVAADLTVTLTSRMLAGQLRGISVPTLRGDPVRRAIYCVTPPSRAHPLTAPFLDAMRAANSLSG